MHREALTGGGAVLSTDATSFHRGSAAIDRPGIVDAPLNCASVLEHHADRFPERVCLVCEGEATTYGEFFANIKRLAGGFIANGVRPGDVVALLAYNSIRFLEIMYAVSYVGGVFMPMNWRLAPPEIAYMLKHAGAKVFISEEELLQLGQASLEGINGVLPLSIDGGEGWIKLEEIQQSEVANPIASVSGTDLQRLMYTSGTTSRPKGVMISHANLAWKNAAHVGEFSITATDVGLAVGPLYHVGALDVTATTLLSAGGKVVLHRRFDARATLSAMADEGITNVWLAPAMINQMLEVSGVDDYEFPTMRFVIYGGEKMPLPLLERFLRLFPNAWVADGYGLTETVSGDAFLGRDHTLKKIGSVGKPCLYVQIEVWDDEGRPVAADRAGEIVVRSPKVFLGYWRDPEATREAFRGGWFRTGDVGYLDEDGFLFLVDRKKDMIVSGGENVSSLEIERVLYDHPAVLEAAVVAKADERWGEVPVGLVVLRPGCAVQSDELRDHCRAELAGYKCPKQFIFLDELPRNPSGKVLKRQLRMQLQTSAENG